MVVLGAVGEERDGELTALVAGRSFEFIWRSQSGVLNIDPARSAGARLWTYASPRVKPRRIVNLGVSKSSSSLVG